MKRTLLIIGTLFFVFTCSNEAHAQFWKKLGDKIADRAENRVINDAADATDKGIGKAEQAAAKGIKGDGKKNNKKNSKLKNKDAASSEGFWPGSADKSSSGSNPLPDNFKLAFTGDGPDLYLKYRMQAETGQSAESEMKITMEMYVSPSRGGRSQMNMEMPVIGNISMAMLSNFNDPNHVIVLNERKEAYSIIDLSDVGSADESNEQYTVTKLGEEDLHGLACTHARATSENGESFEIWTTREIPGYEAMLKLYSKNNKMGSDNLWKALNEADCDGFMVKLYSKTEDAATVMELIEMEKITVPDAMLLVPAGYKESNGGWAKRFMGK